MQPVNVSVYEIETYFAIGKVLEVKLPFVCLKVQMFCYNSTFFTITDW